MNQTLAALLASLIEARQNCRKTQNREWFDRHGRTIARAVHRYMPSGSGIDSGTHLDFDLSAPDKLVFTTSFHHMDSNGFYDGWTEHSVTVRPLFEGFDIRISGRDRNEIKDYLHEVFDCALGRVLTDEEKAPLFAEPREDEQP